MPRVLPIIVALALTVYAFIDCLQADPAQIRGPKRPVWLALIVLVPLFGPAAWLIARSGKARPRKRRTGPPVVPPDDNPEFLGQLRDVDEKHQDMLSEWEADLRRREEEMRRRDGEDDEDDPR